MKALTFWGGDLRSAEGKAVRVTDALDVVSFGKLQVVSCGLPATLVESSQPRSAVIQALGGAATYKGSWGCFSACPYRISVVLASAGPVQYWPV